MSLKRLEILRMVGSSPEAVSRELLRTQLDVPLATLTRFLGEMVETGYLERVCRGRYVLGPRAHYTRGSKMVRPRVTSGTVKALAPWKGMWEAGMATGVTGVLAEAGFNGVVDSLDELSGDYDEWVRGQLDEDADGLVAFHHVPLSEALVTEAERRSIPVVQIGLTCTSNVDTVSWNEYEAYCAMTRHLIEQGCKAILFVEATDQNEMPHIDTFVHLQSRREGSLTAAALLNATWSSIGITLEEIRNGLKGSRFLQEIEQRTSKKKLGVVLCVPTLLNPVLSMLGAHQLVAQSNLCLASCYNVRDSAGFEYFLDGLTIRARIDDEIIGKAAAERLLTRMREKVTAPMKMEIPAPLEIKGKDYGNE